MNYIYIVLETVARELNANLILSMRMIERNFIPIIISQIALRDNLDRLPRGIIIDKGYGLSHYDMHSKIKKLGFKLAVIRSEPIVYDKKLFSLSHKKGLSTVSNIDIFFSLGIVHHDDVLLDGTFDVDTVITGNPRFNLFANKEFRFLFSMLGNPLKFLKEYNKYILIVGNFSDTNFIPKKNSNGLYSISGIDHDAIYERAELEHEIKNVISVYRNDVFISFLNMIDRLCDEFPDYLIVYRPHPSENFGNMRKEFKKRKNFRIIYTDTAATWILNSTVSIQHNCTTSIEAFLLEKPQLSYKELYSKFMDNEETLFTSKRIDTMDSLISIIHDVIDNNNPVLNTTEYSNGRKGLNRYISNIDKELSISKIIDELEKLTISDETNLFKDIRISVYLINSFYFIKRFLSRLFYGELVIQQIQGFNKSNIQRTLDMINKQKLSQFKFKAVTLSSEIFLIERMK